MKQSKFNKKYKALMLDVDGTIVKYDYSALPTIKVRNAVQKAQKRIIVCLVTGRSYGYVAEILAELKIKSGYVIINNGANVFDLSKKTVIYDQPINLSDAKNIIKILRKEAIPFYIKQKFDHRALLDGYFKKGQVLSKAYMIFTDEKYPSARIDMIVDKIKLLSKVSVNKGRHKYPNKYGLNISHVNATKINAVIAIEKELNIKREDIIGVGDGYNDFPLLMACGLKIAMGNAVDDLKAIADYIAPSVEEDGVADIIERFVLK